MVPAICLAVVVTLRWAQNPVFFCKIQFFYKISAWLWWSRSAGLKIHFFYKLSAWLWSSRSAGLKIHFFSSKIRFFIKNRVFSSKI